MRNVIPFPPRTETFKYRDAEVMLTFQPGAGTVKYTGTITQEYHFACKAKSFKQAKKEAKEFIDGLLGEDDE